MAEPWSEEWQADCLKWRGRTLTGEKAHYCLDWDGLPIDETTPEWPCGCAEWAFWRGQIGTREKQADA